MLFSTDVSTSLGTIRIDADDKGLTRIFLPGESAAPTDCTTRNRGGSLPAFIASAAEQIREYCTGRRRVFDLPLSLAGTPFQLLVWDHIRRIPYGRTMTYGEIAREFGGVGKARAVGGAAHANPLPLVIPCHRVIGSNGGLTGFAGGLELKKVLLEIEQQVPASR